MNMIRLFLVMMLGVGASWGAQVLSVDTAPSTVDGTYDAASTITVRVHFDSTVTLAANTDPKLLLSVGRPSGDAAYAYATAGQSGQDIDFVYVVRAGDNSADLDYASANALTDVTGMSGNLPAPGSVGSLGNNAMVVIDTAPLVRSVTTTLGAGTYGIGQIVPVTVQFSEPVFLSSGASANITLQLSSATTTASFVSGSGTSQLQFAYTVISGQTVTALDYASTTALALSGTTPTLKDLTTGGKTATLTLPVTGSPTLRAINIDATPPTVVSITSSAANGSYKTGDSIPLAVQLSEVVTVSGTPTLTLDTTGAATYLSGSGSTNLIFSYIVGATQVSGDLDATSLSLTASSIVDSIGNPASNSVPTGAATSGALANNKEIRIAVPPTITSASVTATSMPSPLSSGTATIRIRFSGSPTITGSGATLNLETGTIDRTAVFSSATSPDLFFTYTVQAGDINAILDYTSINALNIGGVIVDGFSGASFVLPALGGGSSLAASNIRVDTTPSGPPTFTLTPAVTTSATSPIAVAVVASEAITGFIQSDLACVNCSAVLTGASPTYSAALTPVSTLYAGAAASAGSSVVRLKARSGSIALTANMPLQIGSATAFVATDVSVTTALTDVTLKSALSTGVATNADVWLPLGETMTLSIPANAAQDLAGNLSTASSSTSVVYDPTPPSATVSAPANFVSPLIFTIDFSENVSTLTTSGLTASNATLSALTMISAKQYTVAVTPIASGNVSLQVKSNVVLDQASNPNSASEISSFIPISFTQIATNPITPRVCKVGDVIDLIVTLNQTVTFTPSGTPATVLLETGIVDHTASLILPATVGSTNTLTFRYTVVSGDATTDLDVTGISSLNLQGGTLNNLNSLNVPAPGTPGSLSATSAVSIDTVNPTFTLTPAFLISATSPIAVAIVASEPVTGFTDPLTDLTLASLNATATITSSTATAYQAILTPIGDIYMSATQPNSLQLYLRARSGSPSLLANSYILINGNLAVIDTDTTLNSTAASLVTVKSPLPLSIPLNTPVYLPAGISMTVGIPVGAAQDLAGNNNLITSPTTFVYDPMAPIGSILVPTSSASPYEFTVQFNEPVTAPLAAGFTVTGGTVGNPVPAGPNAWTVSVTPTNAGGGVSLALNANAVRDPALNFNAATTATIFAPTFITKIESVPTTPLIKGPGQTVTLVATLSRPSVLTLTSTLPSLALQTGTTPAQAQLTTLAGTTSTLTFSYTVGSSDNSSDLDVVDANALNLNMASIDGLTTMKVPAPGTVGSLSGTSAVTIDTIKPGVTTFGAPSITGALTAVMAVTFNEPIATTGAGTLEITDFTVTGGALVSQVTLAPDGRNATVRFTLPAGSSTLTSYVVSLNAGAVADPAGNTSTDTPSATIVYDPVAPVLTLSTTPGDKATAPLSMVVTASKYVTGMAIEDGNVTNGVVSSISAAVGTSFTMGLTPTATLQLGQAAAIGVTTIRLQAVSGDVLVAAGTVLRVADTMLRLTTTSATTVTSAGINVGIDAALPAAIASGSAAWPANGVVVTTSVRANACVDVIGQGNSSAATPIAVRYDPTKPMFRIAAPAMLAANGKAVFTLTPSEPVSGLTVANLTSDGVVQSAVEADDRLTWTVTVTPVGTTSVSLAIAANAAIDGAGNPSLAEAGVIFPIKPQITRVTADNADGTYNPGTRLRLRVTFSEAVRVSGVPELRLNLTPFERKALYSGGTDSKELLFDYTIVEGDTTTDLDYYSTTALALPNGALIADVDSGNAATLILAVPGQPGSIATSSAIVVNDGGATGPGKPGISDQPAGSGGCGAGSGMALILAGGWLGLGMSLRRRRRAA